MNLTVLLRTQLQKLWPFEGEIRFHRRVANFVYFATLEDRPVVLRLTEPHYRQRAEIESELDWVHFLAEWELTVARSLLSRNGRRVESIQTTESHFRAAVLDENIVREWGKFLGRLHRLSQHRIERFAALTPSQTAFLGYLLPVNTSIHFMK